MNFVFIAKKSCRRLWRLYKLNGNSSRKMNWKDACGKFSRDSGPEIGFCMGASLRAIATNAGCHHYSLSVVK